MSTHVHATAVCVGDTGVLILGPPGSGKTDLALRLMDDGAVLVADDQIIIERQEAKLMAMCPATIAGLMEIKGIGIVSVAHRPQAEIHVVVELVTEEEAVPEPAFLMVEGVRVRCVRLCPFNSAAAAKVRLAVTVITGKTKATHSSLGDAA